MLLGVITGCAAGLGEAEGRSRPAGRVGSHLRLQVARAGESGGEEAAPLGRMSGSAI